MTILYLLGARLDLATNYVGILFKFCFFKSQKLTEKISFNKVPYANISFFSD